MSNQLKKLESVLSHMKEAEKIIEDLRTNEEDSLNNYYGYSLEIIQQQLNKLSDNSQGYLGRDSCIGDIIESEGDKWEIDK